jgi:hypothetical protein
MSDKSPSNASACHWRLDQAGEFQLSNNFAWLWMFVVEAALPLAIMSVCVELQPSSHAASSGKLLEIIKYMKPADKQSAIWEGIGKNQEKGFRQAGVHT